MLGRHFKFPTAWNNGIQNLMVKKNMLICIGRICMSNLQSKKKTQTNRHQCAEEDYLKGQLPIAIQSSIKTR